MRRLKLLWLDICSSKTLFAVPLVLSGLIFFLVTRMVNLSPEDKACRFGNLAQEALIIAFLCWPLLVLKRWVSGEEVETLRAVKRGDASCAAGIGIMLAGEMLAFSILVLLGRYTGIFIEGECFRVFALSAFLSALFYLLSILFRSVSVPMVLLIAYCIFSMIFNGSGRKVFLLVDPARSWKRESLMSILRFYFPFLGAAVALIWVSGALEKKLYKGR